MESRNEKWKDDIKKYVLIGVGIFLLVIIYNLAKSNYVAQAEVDRYQQAIAAYQAEALAAIAEELENPETQCLSADSLYKLYYCSRLAPREKHFKLAATLLQLADSALYAEFSEDERKQLASDIRICETMDSDTYYEFLLAFAVSASEHVSDRDAKQQ